MSLPQGAEISLAYADFLATHVGVFDDIRWGPAYTNGTRVFAREDGVWRAFLLTDLTSPARFPSSTFKIERAGSSSVSIAANNLNGTSVVTLSPVLPDANLANYIAFSNVDFNASVWAARAWIHATNQLILRVFQAITLTAGSASTGISITPGSLASVTDTDPVSTAHGADADLLPHSHGTTSHAVSDPAHTHILTGTSGAVTVTVDWIIIHV